MKKIKFYVVKKKSDPNTIYCFLENKKQLWEYVNTKLMIENKEHYENWCELHGKVATDQFTWLYYIKEIIPYKLDEYYVEKYIYDIAGLASILRMFNMCEPVYASYETESEHNYINFIKEIIDQMEKNEVKHE